MSERAESDRRSTSTASVLPPFPDGWYVIALSADLRPGAIVSTTFLGRERIVYRTSSGAAVVQDAFCPHLGAHLGHGGCVQGDTIECPFHKFRFDASGQCVATGYGTKAPKKAVLETLPVREIAGTIVAFHGQGEPTWEPSPIDLSGWTDMAFHSWSLRGHPQETSENSVDFGHLGAVHDYQAVTMLGELHTEGAYLNARYSFDRPRGLLEGSKNILSAVASIHLHGLGWSFVEAEIASLGLRTRQLVLATPVDGERITLRIGMAVQLERPSRVNPALALLPPGYARRLVRHLALRGFVADVEQDFAIWKNKVHLSRPALAAGDGPIGAYRRWTRQFYRDRDEPADEGEPAGRLVQLGRKVSA
jgi:nitrite reductase/ring-hydroxylating ferredoxin subunit